MSTNIKWNGDEVNAKVEAAIIKFLHAAGMVVQGDAVNRCPVDTGNLRQSIAFDVDEDAKSTIVGTNVHYAPYVELGTVKMKAQPFLRPALDKNRSGLSILLQDYINSYLGGG